MATPRIPERQAHPAAISQSRTVTNETCMRRSNHPADSVLVGHGTGSLSDLYRTPGCGVRTVDMMGALIAADEVLRKSQRVCYNPFPGLGGCLQPGPGFQAAQRASGPGRSWRLPAPGHLSNCHS